MGSFESVPLAGRIVLSLFISCVQKKIDENDLLKIIIALFHFDCFAVLSNVVTWIEKITFKSQKRGHGHRDPSKVDGLGSKWTVMYET